jgi:multidrug resistance efflux pump
MKRHRFLFAGALLVMVLLGLRQYRLARGETVAAEPGPVAHQVVARAAVAPAQGIAEVRPRVGGRVVRVFVREGEAVNAGDTLLEIESTLLGARLQGLEAQRRSLAESAQALASGARPPERRALAAQVRAARQEHQLAQDRAARQLQLFQEGAVTESIKNEAAAAAEIARAQLEVAEARVTLARSGGSAHELEAAKARVAAASAAVTEMRAQMEWARITAPVSGVVIVRRVDPGDTVLAHLAALGPPLIEIADTKALEVVAEIEERDIARVAEGQRVTLAAPGGSPLLGEGRVVRLGARVRRREIGGDPAMVRADSLVLPVFIDLSDSSLRLPLGQRLEARVHVQPEAAAVRLPRESVTVREGQAWVQIAGPFGRRAVPVQLGVTDEEHVEVAGLEPGVAVYRRPL